MKIVADDKIPFLRGVLEPWAEVLYLPGDQIRSADLQDADALLVRTRTTCDEDLLRNTRISLVASATIGTDHLDTDWLEHRQIAWVSAPGCNADSVEQYVSAALLFWMTQHRAQPEDLTIGIIGAGNVGSRVARSCSLMGMRVLLNDPPRERAGDKEDFHPLDRLLQQADILSFHVPLTHSGPDKTYHLLNDHLISSLPDETLLINTCRGEVFVTRSVIDGIQSGRLLPPVIDCWENEPTVPVRLLDQAYLATPHIAGYSQEGKANGTTRIIRALARHFHLPLTDWTPASLPDPEHPLIRIDGTGKSPFEVLREAVHHTYPIWEDDDLLRKNPLQFKSLRGSYRIRREYPAYRVDPELLTAEQISLLSHFRFVL